MNVNKYLTPSTEIFAEMARTIDVDSVPDDKKAALLVPVLVIFRDQRYNRSPNLVLAALSYTKTVLEKGGDKISIPSDMFVEVFTHLGAVCDQPGLSAANLEEVRLSSFTLTEKLISSQDEINLGPLYTARCLPALGHMVSLLISTFESTPSSPSLKLTSLRCLKALISPNNCQQTPSLQAQISIVILTFMPGILTALTHVLKTSADPRSSASLLAESLSVLGPVLTTVLCEENTNKEAAEIGQQQFVANCPQDGLQRLNSAGILPPLPLNKEYLHEVGKRVSPVVATIFSPSLFSLNESVDPRVRKRAFEIAVNILSKSAQFLTIKDACGAILNCIVASLAEIDEKNEPVFDELEQIVAFMPKIGDLAEDSFMELVRNLPQFVSNNSINFEVILSAKLASMTGYSRLLGKVGRLSQLFSSHDCLMDFFRCATRVCQLQPLSMAALGVAPAPPPSQVIASASLDDHEMWQVRLPRQELPFRYLDNVISRKLFEKLIEILVGQVDDFSNFVSFFYETMIQQLDEQDTSNDFRLESSSYVLSVMISSLCSSSSVNSWLEVPSLACVERFCSDSSLFVRNRASLLLLGACSKAAATLKSNEVISTIIRRSILALLEACSSGKSFVENHAIHTLAEMAKAAKSRTLAHFIETNADYLANAFSIRLCHLAVSRNTLYAIAAAFRFSVPGCLPYFSDPLRDIISHIPTSDYDPELAELLLLAANNAMKAIQRWDLPCTCEQSSSPQLEEQNDEEFENVARSDKKEWPNHIILARDTADAVIVLFSSHHVNIKLSALEIARLSVLIIRTATNELLPLVHRLWPGVSARFIPSETRKQVILKALDLLMALAETSGDFIRHRFVTGMLPHVCTAIDHLVETLTKSGVRLTVYRQTFDYKLLVRLVADLPRLANLVKITVSSDLQKIGECVLSALRTAVEVNPEAASLEKAATDGLSQLLLENQHCVRDLIKNQISNQEISPKLSELLLPLLSSEGC